MNTDFLNNFREEIKKMFKSKVFWVWVTLIFSWLFWNWRIWYITFFIDPELLLKRYGILKLDYIECFYQGFLHNLVFLFIAPLFSCFFLFFVFDKLVTKFVGKLERNELKRDDEINKVYREYLQPTFDEMKREKRNDLFKEVLGKDYSEEKPKEKKKSFISKIKDFFN